jgi:hypothetical protein
MDIPGIRVDSGRSLIRRASQLKAGSGVVESPPIEVDVSRGEETIRI